MAAHLREAQTTTAPITELPDGAPDQVIRPQRYPVAIGSSALLVLLISAWAGLSIFIGPSFGFRPDGGSGLTWDLVRGVLTVAPAIGGVVGGLLMLALAGQWHVGGGRHGLALGAWLVALSGAWLAIGFVAWPAIGGSQYLTAPNGLNGFDAALGVAIGPGILLIALSLMVLGFLLGSAGASRLMDEIPTASPPLRPTPILVEGAPGTAVPPVAETED